MLITLTQRTCLASADEIRTTEHPEIFLEGSPNEINVLRDSLKNSRVEIDPTFKIDFAKSSVSGENLNKLKSLCEEFNDIFSKSQYDLGSCTAGEHDIITNSETPVSSRPHKTPFKYHDELQKHIDQLLASGVMIESDTPWVSNIVLVQKKDGGLRPCIDFRKLNEVTIPDHYPLPRLEAIMDRIGNCHYYSSLDLSSGYLQIRLTENASRKCGLITEDKIYQMINLPFGLRNATSAFARCMAHVLSGLDNCVVAYVDDIVVFTKPDDFETHLSSLKSVFERFRRFNLKLSPKKCIFAAATMNFLGYIVNSNGYTPSLGKVEVIKNLPNPKTVREVKHVVGMASFFRKHIPNFSTIVEPLTRLTKKEKNFEWGEEQNNAFNKIKEILTQEPVLIFPDYEKPFHIFTDASTVGQGGALMQKNEENKTFDAIAYCSRTLSMSERRWPAVQAELGAIIFALRTFKPYIFMAEIELHCDHKPLAFLLKKSDAHPNLARWLIELQNYNIKIIHVAGKQNLLADGLSRFPQENIPETAIKDLSELQDIANFPVCLSLSLKPRVVHEQFILNLTARDIEGKMFSIDIRREQGQDPETKLLIEFLEFGTFPAGITENDKEEITSKSENMSMISGILHQQMQGQVPRIYIPMSLRPLIFEAFHTSVLSGGHMNLKKTLNKCRKFYWPMMHRDIANWTKLCITCQLRHSPNPAYRAEMQMPPKNTLFAQIALDLAGPLPLTQKGNKHLLNIICTFTKYIISVPLPDAKAKTIAMAFFKNCYLKFGGCTNLLTDNATAFTSDFFKSFCSLLYINKCYATPHWSQGNPVVERSFRTFHNILSKYLSKDEPDFDEYIECATFCYNTSTHASTNETPFFLMYGRDPIFCIEQIIDPKIDLESPIEVNEFKQKLVNVLGRAWESAAAVIQETQLRAKTQYDKLVRNPTILVGDRVLLRNYTGKVGTSKKFHMPWKGLFRVTKIDGVLVTILSCTSPQSNPRVVHINQIKKYYEESGPPNTQNSLPQSEKEALDNSQAQEQVNVPGYSHSNRTQTQTSDKQTPISLPTEDLNKTQDPGTEPETNNTPQILERQGKSKYGLRNKPRRKNFSD
uniref:RNA-directed DNA polymerase n=1 Tax=Meloidogyne enterolobii TaxID=390850 RepID=A0A6V7X1R5_MELEN|nr:unnamed protein product [Meloidogyne enterolobii]